jgi:Transglutaminase-like superfamily
MDKVMISRLLIIFFLLVSIWIPKAYTIQLPSETKLKVLYNSLDPTSITQHLAFYELYYSTSLGKRAFQDAWNLLTGSQSISIKTTRPFPLSDRLIQALVNLVNKQPEQDSLVLDAEALKLFEHLSSRLAHYRLKGHQVWTEQEVLALPLADIDVARGLFIGQFGENRQQILTYEALIDLMAFQVLARLKPQASPQEKITALNHLIFDEMGFRFPPHSLHSKDIDVYTFLPSVLDSHRGVCLGVSILYMCLAQRLNLELEMITPPGHIYVRYRSGSQVINIETTARGIHMDSKEYLGLNNRSLELRTIREVIGMAHFNQASVFWQKKDYLQVLTAYQRAAPYMCDDPLLKELMGYALLLTNHMQEGENLLREVQSILPDYAVVKGTTIDDYFDGQVGLDGLEIMFTHAEEDRASILAKKLEIENVLQRYPYFRAGHLALASLWMKLHRMGETVETLKTYCQLCIFDPEAHYYLAVLFSERYNYPLAWSHLKQAEAITAARNYYPTELKELRRELISRYPEPQTKKEELL